MEKLNSIFFYNLERSIKAYRQYAQTILKAHGYSITIDQWLILKAIIDDPDIAQNELAEAVFKDKASINRIIDLLIRHKYLTREKLKENRKFRQLTVTRLGHQILADLNSIVIKNRAQALKGISIAEIERTEKVLIRIFNNCKSK
ncbi:MAG: MarR family transcriptional regulator [Bacteroidia bacterium]|jgi:DNA-binding MarR family transcriptional regulator